MDQHTVDQHTGDKWFTHSTKHCKDNKSQSLKPEMIPVGKPDARDKHDAWQKVQSSISKVGLRTPNNCRIVGLGIIIKTRHTPKPVPETGGLQQFPHLMQASQMSFTPHHQDKQNDSGLWGPVMHFLWLWTKLLIMICTCSDPGPWNNVKCLKI